MLRKEEAGMKKEEVYYEHDDKYEVLGRCQEHPGYDPNKEKPKGECPRCYQLYLRTMNIHVGCS
jgi:hypothetical protein